MGRGSGGSGGGKGGGGRGSGGGKGGGGGGGASGATGSTGAPAEAPKAPSEKVAKQTTPLEKPPAGSAKFEIDSNVEEIWDQKLVKGPDPYAGQNYEGSFDTKGLQPASYEISEVRSITAYTGGQVVNGERFAGINAERLNRFLYDKEYAKSLSPKIREQMLNYKKELVSDLDKLADYRGEVYRVLRNKGLQTKSGSLTDQGLAAGFEPGKMAHFNEFLSTSYQPSLGDMSLRYNSPVPGSVRFKITSKHGKLAEDASSFTSEREIIFKAGSNFMTTSKKWNAGTRTWDITLEEI